MLLIKVVLLISCFSMKNNQKDSADFSTEKNDFDNPKLAIFDNSMSLI